MNAGWLSVRLGEHVDLLSGFAFKSKHFTDNPDDIPLVKGANVHQGYIDWEKAVRWPREEFSDLEKYHLQVGDVILAMDRPWIEAGLKYSWIKPNDPSSMLVQRVSRMRGVNGLSSRYLRYVIGSPQFTNYIKPIVTGVNVPHISGGQIKDYKFQLPPELIQEQIADIIEPYDNLIENNNRRIAILEEMAQSLYREWFVKFRFPGHENCQLKDSLLGQIPEGWKVKKLFDISSPTYGFAFKSRQFNADNEGTKVVRIRDVPNNDSKTYTLEEPRKEAQILKNGDLLIGMDGDFHMGKWAGGHAYLCQRVVKITPEENISPYFTFLSFQKPIKDLNKSIVGTTVAHLGDKHLKEVLIVIADDSLMKEFSEIVDPIFRKELNLRLKNQNLKKQRDMVLPKLISGSIGPS